MSSPLKPRTILILGSSYAGKRAFDILSASTAIDPRENVRVFVIDRQSHFNHVYVFPRYCILPGHEHKAFIPFPASASQGSSSESSTSSSLTLASPEYPANSYLQADVVSLTSSSVTLSRSFPELGIPSPEIGFDFLIYALGSIMPKPLRMPANHIMKPQGMDWMKRRQAEVAAARDVVIVGGGALGIQCATDIKHLYPDTHTVTLIHSRSKLLPKFSDRMHEVVMDRFDQLGIKSILSDRLCSTHISPDGFIQTLKDERIKCDLLLLCTGQKPNTTLVTHSSDQDLAHCVDPYTGLLKVNGNLQVISYVRPEGLQDNRCAKGDDCICFPAPPPIPSSEKPGASPQNDNKIFERIYAVGDAADAFGAIKAGHTAYYQAETAARNILAQLSGETLEEYKSGLKSIKLTLGLGQSVVQKGEEVEKHFGGSEDLDAHLFWPAGREVNND